MERCGLVSDHSKTSPVIVAVGPAQSSEERRGSRPARVHLGPPAQAGSRGGADFNRYAFFACRSQRPRDAFEGF